MLWIWLNQFNFGSIFIINIHKQASLTCLRRNSSLCLLSSSSLLLSSSRRRASSWANLSSSSFFRRCAASCSRCLWRASSYRRHSFFYITAFYIYILGVGKNRFKLIHKFKKLIFFILFIMNEAYLTTKVPILTAHIRLFFQSCRLLRVQLFFFFTHKQRVHLPKDSHP